MKFTKKAIAAVLLLLCSEAAFAGFIVTQRVVNVQSFVKGSTTVTLSGRLSEEAMDEIVSGKSMAIYNRLDSYLVFPTLIPKSVRGVEFKDDSKSVSVLFKNRKLQWSEKGLTNYYVFAIGRELESPESVTLKSSGTLQSAEPKDFLEKRLAILDMREKELGVKTLGALRFSLLSTGKTFRYSCKENGVQAKIAVNSKRRITAQFKLSPDAASPACLESESIFYNNYKCNLEIAGEGKAELSYVGPNRVLLNVTENARKFRYFSFDDQKFTNQCLYVDLYADKEFKAVFGTYDFDVVAEGDGFVETDFTGPDEITLTAVNGSDSFHRFEWNGSVSCQSPSSIQLVSDTVVTAMFMKASYLVVDLSRGSSGKKWPYRFTAIAPDIQNDKCRKTELWLRYVPPGEYMMGSPENEIDRGTREDLHKVTISEGFYIGVFEVTSYQFKLITDTTYPGTEETYPTRKINYDILRGEIGAEWPAHDEVSPESVIGVIRSKTGLRFDIPTEAQWEYACRATTATAYNSGNNKFDKGFDLSVICNDIHVGLQRVGVKKPNRWGLYDMHGNVYEWCLDWYVDNLGSAPAIDPKGPETGTVRVLRGGCYRSWENECRSAYRSYTEPDHDCRQDFYERFGFRLVVNGKIE